MALISSRIQSILRPTTYHFHYDRFLGGEEDRITAPIPPGALCDDRRPEPRNFSGFYYASPELRRHDGVTSRPFVDNINVEHDYQTIDVEQQAVAIRQAMEELKVNSDGLFLDVSIDFHLRILG